MEEESQDLVKDIASLTCDDCPVKSGTHAQIENCSRFTMCIVMIFFFLVLVIGLVLATGQNENLHLGLKSSE